MRVTEMDRLYAYNWWATSRVLQAADGLSDEQFARTDIAPVPFGSLRGTLVHILDLERSARHWLSRNPKVEPLDEQNYATPDQLARAWRSEAAAMKDYLIGLEEEHMDGDFSVNASERCPYWQYLMHVLNHSTQHRSEAAVLMTAMGRSPGDLDLALFLRESST